MGVLERILLRLLGSVVLIAIFYNQVAHTNIEMWIGYSLIALLTLLFVWWRRIRTYSVSYIVNTAVTCITTLVLFYQTNHSDVSSLLWPAVCFLGLAPRRLNFLTNILMGFIVMDAVILAFYDQFNLLPFLGLIGLFLGFRARNVRREAQEIQAKHLKELDKAHQALQKAHHELQEATVQSMYYAALTERTRLSREIHDGLGHQLTSLIIQLQALQLMIAKDPEKAEKVVKELLGVARKGLQEVRMVVREWSEDESGLGSVALRGLVSQTKAHSLLDCEYIHEGEEADWPHQVSITLYRILQEGLTNVLRHSKATKAKVRVKEKEDLVMLEIQDEGEFNEDTLPGFGIQGMKQRAEELRGSCDLFQNEWGGLTVKVIIPLAGGPDYGK